MTTQKSIVSKLSRYERELITVLGMVDEPTVSSDILEHLRQYPGSRPAEIAECVGAACNHVTSELCKMKAAGVVVSPSRGVWELNI